jgi:hypothetical protein
VKLRILAAIGLCMAAIAVTLGAAGAVVLFIALLRGNAGRVHWGDLSGWASATASAAIFIAGVILFRRDNRFRRQDEDRLSKTEQRQHDFEERQLEQRTDGGIAIACANGRVYISTIPLRDVKADELD